MVNRKTNLTNAFETTLSAEMSSVASSMSLTDTTGLTEPFYLVIEPENASQREYVYVSALAGGVATVSERYLAGSAAGSGLTHPSGSTVRMAAFSQHIADANDRIDDLQSQVTAAGDHGGLTGLTDDDHPGYLNEARHDADDHDAFLHASRHLAGGSDPLPLGDIDARARTVVRVDGTGNLARRALNFVTGQGVGFDALADDPGNEEIDIPIKVVPAEIDHGALANLTDDVHIQYVHKSTLGGKGHIVTATAAQTVYDLAPGAGGTVLISDPLVTPGLKWHDYTLPPNGDNTDDLGSATYSWRRLYAFQLFDENGNARVSLGAKTLEGGDWLTTGDLQPDTDLTHDLGSGTATWRRLYVQDIYDEAGNQRIDTSIRRLEGGEWDIAGDFMPDSEANNRDLGSAAAAWRRLYVQAVFDESGTAYHDISNHVFHDGTRRLFRMTFALNGSQLRGEQDGDFFEIDSTNSWFQWFINDTEVGALRSNGDWETLSGSYGTLSDASVKENIRDMGPQLAKLLRVPMRDFYFKPLDEERFGAVAQEVEPIFPELVSVGANGKKYVSQTLWIPKIVKAIQELASHVGLEPA